MTRIARQQQKRDDSHLVQPLKDNHKEQAANKKNSNSTSAKIIQLQRTHGNQFVQRLVESGTVQRESIEGDLNISGNLNVGGSVNEGKGGNVPPAPPMATDDLLW